MSEHESRQTIEYTTPAYRLAGVLLAAGAVVALGYYFRQVNLEHAFGLVASITIFGAVTRWARKRPDQLKIRTGVFFRGIRGFIEDADAIRKWSHERTFSVSLLISAAKGIAVLISQQAVVYALHSFFAWPLVVAVGCGIGALVVSPETFRGLIRRARIGGSGEAEDEVERRRREKEERREDSEPEDRAEGEE